MESQHSDQLSSDEPQPDPPRSPYEVFASRFPPIVLALNCLIAFLASNDRSWGALGLALFIGPIFNLTLGVAACLLIPLRRQKDPAYPVFKHVLLAFGLPLIGTILCGFAILSMDLHGC